MGNAPRRLAGRGGWHELTPGAAELISFVTPKQLDTSRTRDRRLQSEASV